MFDTYPSYWRYRTLRLIDPPMQGEDVYALQIGLNAVRDFTVPVVPDGILGLKTSKAIVAVQKFLKIVADGYAGQQTQRAIALRIGKAAKKEFPLPAGLPGGQIGHESSFLLGNYSPQRSDGSYDAGVVQRNISYHDPMDAFDPVSSIRLLCSHVFNNYQKYSSVENEKRRWELAVGSWNAPYYTNYLAGVKPYAIPGPTALQKLEEYIASATAYMKL